jgi:CubicO group peptidase (beta-lactamase class C family)
MTAYWQRVLHIGALMLVMALFGGCNRAGEPLKPDPIPVGDFTYAGDLAAQRLEALMEQYHMPGAAAALIVDQEIVWQGHFGLAEIASATAVSEATIFKLWSLAKPLTAVEMMRLVEEGRVDLDAPINTYIPDFSIQSRFPSNEAITIRHILAHRSGISRNGCARPDWYFGPDALEWAASSLKDCTLAYPTGTRYKYSNVSYGLLGYIIQDQRGQPFPVAMFERLLAPLEMTDSSFWTSDLFDVGQLDKTRIATGYAYNEGEQYPYEQVDFAMVPSSNLYATIGDLANFVRFFLRGGEAGGEQLIAKETLRAMAVDQYSRPGDPQPMGLGWKIGPQIGPERVVWHDGGPSEGIGSLIAMLPEQKLGVILLANSTAFAGSVALPLALELLQTMAETAGGAPAVEAAAPEVVTVEPAVLQSYAGDYAIMGQMMAVDGAGDHLKANLGGFTFDLLPIAENRFKIDHWLLRLGAARFLPLPAGFEQTEIMFQPASDVGDDVAIFDFGGMAYEIGVRYPDLAEIPPAWEAMAGLYDRYEQLESGEAGAERLGGAEITVADGRLHMSDPMGPILPLDERTLIILSGPFAGETIGRDPQSGVLTHQYFVYQPAGDGP